MMKIIPRASLLLLALSTALTLGACPKDPYDPQTWIDKLDDPNEMEEAITQLERLRCPKAIKALGKVWKKHNRWSKVLRVMIALADQPDMNPSSPKWKNFKSDCGNPGEGPFWDDAVPFLIEAVEDFDVTDDREIQDAAVAAEALGKAKSDDAIQVLIAAATKKEKLYQGQMVRIAAVKALGAYGNNARTVDTIIKVLETPAATKTIRLNASAANALAMTGSEKAIVPLLKALFEIPPIYQQVRTAITTIGQPAADALVQVFAGKHAEMNALATEHKFAIDCDKGEGPESTCKAPGNLRFKSAMLLGDMRVKSAAQMLIKGLDEKEKVSFFTPDGAPGPSDHNAILDALRTMGAFEAAPALEKYIQAESTNDLTRPLAIDVYSMLAKDGKAMGYLQKAFENTENEMPLRQASTLAYARLVTKPGQLKPIQAIIDLQLKSAVEADEKAKKAKKEEDKKEFELQGNDYRRFAREYEQHRTRARAGIVCGQDLACYQDLLTLKAADVVAKLEIPNHRRDTSKPIAKRDMDAYRIAALERALLEVAKMGKSAEPAFKDLLKNAESTDRIVRQGVLLALVQVAPTPCNDCVNRLNEIIEAQSGQTTLDNLTSDTRIVMNYFKSQGGKLTAAKAAAPAEEAKK